MSELRPCPFCGGRARAELFGVNYIVFCVNQEECRAVLKTYDATNEAEAIGAWNTRADESKLAAAMAVVECARNLWNEAPSCIERCGDTHHEPFHYPRCDAYRVLLADLEVAIDALERDGKDAG